MSAYQDDEPAVYTPPKIRYRERVDFTLDALDPTSELVRRVDEWDRETRALIAVIYPPLPAGYVWVREMTSHETRFDAFAETISYRYVVRHVDEIPAGVGAIAWRP